MAAPAAQWHNEWTHQCSAGHWTLNIIYPVAPFNDTLWSHRTAEFRVENWMSSIQAASLHPAHIKYKIKLLLPNSNTDKNAGGVFTQKITFITFFTVTTCHNYRKWLVLMIEMNEKLWPMILNIYCEFIFDFRYITLDSIYHIVEY